MVVNRRNQEGEPNPGQVLSSYAQMIVFALARLDLTKRKALVFLLLLVSPFRYLLQPEGFVKTPFGLFRYTDKGELRAIVYGCFKTTFAYLQNIETLCPPGRCFNTVVDVGANLGDFALALRGHADTVYAIEPSRRFSEILKQNIRINQARNVIPIYAAAYNRDTMLFLNGHGSDLFIDSETGRETLRGIRTDWIIGELSGASCLIKVDVQGSEIQVIEGMKSILSSGVTRLLIVEVHQRKHVNPATIVSLVFTFGYQLVRVDKYLFDQPQLYFSPKNQQL